MLSNTTQPTQDGGRSGNTPALKDLIEFKREVPELVKLSTLVTEECLLLRINKTRKLNQLLFLEILEEETKLNNGSSDMLINWEMKLIKRKDKEMLNTT
jgi:hypothetical protein